MPGAANAEASPLFRMPHPASVPPITTPLTALNHLARGLESSHSCAGKHGAIPLGATRLWARPVAPRLPTLSSAFNGHLERHRALGNKKNAFLRVL